MYIGETGSESVSAIWFGIPSWKAEKPIRIFVSGQREDTRCFREEEKIETTNLML